MRVFQSELALQKFEFLQIAANKSEFLSSLRPGDRFLIKIVELIGPKQGILSIKGNLVSASFAESVSLGDQLNVEVIQIGDKIIFKNIGANSFIPSFQLLSDNHVLSDLENSLSLLASKANLLPKSLLPILNLINFSNLSGAQFYELVKLFTRSLKRNSYVKFQEMDGSAKLISKDLEDDSDLANLAEKIETTLRQAAEKNDLLAKKYHMIKLDLPLPGKGNQAIVFLSDKSADDQQGGKSDRKSAWALIHLVLSEIGPVAINVQFIDPVARIIVAVKKEGKQIIQPFIPDFVKSFEESIGKISLYLIEKNEPKDLLYTALPEFLGTQNIFDARA